MNGIALEHASEALGHFKIEGTVNGCAPYGNGHINSTYIVSCAGTKGNGIRYILQAINQNAFKNPDEITSNISKVTAFLKENSNSDRSVMELLPTVDGGYAYRDGDNNYWRMYSFVENSICIDRPDCTEDFKQCAIAFGRFQRSLNDFPADELYETITDFHNTPKRYENFLRAVEQDVCSRAAGVEKEIEFVKQRAEFYYTLYNAYDEGKLPLRVTHNDTKSNNVLLDKDTHKALCVIDLDTIMPGFSVNDFGDAIRFGASTAAEDEKDLDKVKFDLAMFDAYTDGFLEGCGGLLTDSEIMLLPEGSKMMTVECGMRFLTDYLSGDTYFKTTYPEQNLDRCRTQFKLVSEMEANWQAMKNTVKKYLKG